MAPPAPRSKELSLGAALVLSLGACGAGARPARVPVENAGIDARAERRTVPVVLIHGIDDTPRVFAPLRVDLAREGFEQVSAVALVPNDGTLPMEALAAQVSAHVDRVLRETGSAQVDVVAFSMGALVARVWLLEQGGRPKVRRFVSISGPHAGTASGWLRGNAGATQMRWNSPLLRRLGAGAAALAPVEVFSLWTPLDLMIVPASSSRLEGARERTFPVLLHPLMLQDGRVLRAVTEALRVRDPDDFATGHPLGAQPVRW